MEGWMITITVEIKEDKFSYDFEVGKEKGHGDHPLNVQSIRLFSAIVEDCHRSWVYDNNQEIKEIECLAYLEKHPEVVKKLREKVK
jgi:hypothetical protein